MGAQRSSGLQIGSIAGARVVVHPGWAVIVALVAVLFGPVVRSYLPGLGGWAYLVAAVFGVVMLVSVLAHELAHALGARRFGVALHRISATLTGGHTEMDHARTPGATAVIAACGPAANLLLAAIAWWVLQLLPDQFLRFPVPGVTTGGVAALLLTATAGWNAMIAVLNLLPGLPLDGGRLVEALIWRLSGRRTTGTVVAGWCGRVLAVALVLAALVLPYAQGTSPDLVTAVWVGLVAAFLWMAASSSLKSVARERMVASLSLDALVVPALSAPVATTLAEVDGGPWPDPEVVVIGAGGEPVGYVDRVAARAVPHQLRGTTTLGAVLVPLPPGAVVESGLIGQDAVRAVAQAARSSPVMVVRGPSGVTGLLQYTDVVAALRS